MAATQIPNLLTARNPRPPGGGGPGGSSRARGGLRRHDAVEEPAVDRAAKDKIVQGTDLDANISRMSAVEVGYLSDPFAKAFATVGGQRRFPIINRGTYMRTRAIDLLVETFLDVQPSIRKQIISLGAGSDTRYFRLSSRRSPPDVLYHELDFPINTALKIATIHADPSLRHIVHIDDPISVLATDTELHAPNYHIHALDLRSLGRGLGPASPDGSGKLGHIDPALPTLLISECCLTYLAPDIADHVVRHFLSLLAPATPAALILYEPINPFDAFGKVMVSNLAARGIVMQTLHKYHSLEAQKARMRDYGFVTGKGAVDVDFVYQEWVEEPEKRRVSALEMLDEVEELNLLAKHYCIAWGWREGSRRGEDRGIWEGWRALRGTEEQEEVRD